MQKKVVKPLSLALLMAITFIVSAPSAYASTVTETITPSAWQAASGAFLTNAQSSTTPPTETIAYRDAPGTVINTNLNSPEPTGGSSNELAMITFGTGLVCSSDTTVDVSVSTFSRELTFVQVGNDEHTISSGLIDLSGPTVTGYSQASRNTTGTYTAISPISYSTTAGNLSNVAVFTNFEAATILGGVHYQGTAELGIPTITLEYNDSNCNRVPTINNVSVTISSSSTVEGGLIVSGNSLSAEDGDGDTLRYSIASGNDQGYFAIDSTNGNISATRSNLPTGTYVLTVLVDDGNGGTATAEVTIIVTDNSLADTGQSQYLIIITAAALFAGGLRLAQKQYRI